MKDILLQLTRPRLLLAVLVVLCATYALIAGVLGRTEWAGAIVAAMWWNGASGASEPGKTTGAKAAPATQKEDAA